jgi:hypothetical protein
LNHLEERRIVREEHIEGVQSFTLEECLLIASKFDSDEAEAHLELLEQLKPDGLEVLPVSTETGQGLEELRQTVYEKLKIVRIYSKVPGREPDMDAPFVMDRGGTVMEFAEQVHKELAQHLKTARVWGSAKFDGAAVAQDHVLQDQDVVELRAER